MQQVQAEAFWDDVYTKLKTYVPDESDPALVSAMAHFGDIRGLRVLDLGCGDGNTSIFFAQRGANVVAIDTSEVAIQSLTEFCTENSINNIKAVKCSAFDIDQLGPFDFVFGRMILHHLEPFGGFAEVLRKSIAPGGKAFFHENNAASDLLVWFRNNIVGKFGIPKYGDDDEFPLLPSEVKMLKNHFSVEQDYPKMVFLSLASVYFTKGKLNAPMQIIDGFLFKVPGMKRYSYQQYLMLS